MPGNQESRLEQRIHSTIAGKRTSLLKEMAAEGSISAIATLTGVSRQTLHRWQRAGRSVTLASVTNRLKPSAGLNGNGPRGRPLGTFKQQRTLKGFARPGEAYKAGKTVHRALVDLSEALMEQIILGGMPSLEDLLLLMNVLPSFLTLIPDELVIQALPEQIRQQILRINSDHLETPKTAPERQKEAPKKTAQ